MSQDREVSARAQRVWLRLNEWYGARMGEQYGPTPPPDWCRLVDRSTNAEMKRALLLIRTKHPSFPPTLPEFEIALRPPPPVHRGPTEDTVQEKLVKHAISHYALGAEQLIQHATFLYQRRQWTDVQGRPRDELADCVGVVFAPAAGRPEIRIAVGDLGL